MKIVCEKENILKAINSVTKAVASKTTMPILEGILIQTNDNDIKFTTYDLEMGIEYIINEAQIIEQGATVVNSIMFSEIIRKLPDTEISISLDKNNLLIIECEGSLYKLATMNPEEFPELPKIDVENSIELEQKSLKEMIRKTIFAVSTEENRPIFTGCLFEIKNNEMMYYDSYLVKTNYNAFKYMYTHKMTDESALYLKIQDANNIMIFFKNILIPTILIGYLITILVYYDKSMKLLKNNSDFNYLYKINGFNGTDALKLYLIEDLLMIACSLILGIFLNFGCNLILNLACGGGKYNLQGETR